MSWFEIAERFQVGQNIASESSTESGYSPDVTTFLQMWYDEVKLFDSNQVSKYKWVKTKFGKYRWPLYFPYRNTGNTKYFSVKTKVHAH